MISAITRSGMLVYMFLVLSGVFSSSLAAERLKPYILAEGSNSDFSSTIARVREALKSRQFKVVGEYAPYEHAHIIIVTNDDLIALAAKESNAAYMSVQRVAITQTETGLQVSYTNPAYFANAYRVSGDVGPVTRQLAAALGSVEPFGSKGLTVKELRRYHYSFGMEYFDDPLELAQYNSHREALRTVEDSLASGRGGTELVYRLDIPYSDISVFGVALSDGMADDRRVMEVIDYKPLKQTAHLPYEVLVTGREVVALAPRFRIAIDFPDLRMVGEHGFTRIMATPDAIKKALTLTAGGEWQDPGFAVMSPDR